MTQYGISPVGRQQPAGTIQHLPSVERYNELILILFLSPESKIINLPVAYGHSARQLIADPCNPARHTHAGVELANRQNKHRIAEHKLDWNMKYPCYSPRFFLSLSEIEDHFTALVTPLSSFSLNFLIIIVRIL